MEAQPVENQQHEGYRVKIQPAPNRIRAELDGKVIADSLQALIMTETRQPEVFYFPREDVRMHLLASNPLTTHCPFKGNANYFDYCDGSNRKQEVPQAAWSYEDGFDEAALIRGYIAFDWNKVDAWYEGNDKLISQRGATNQLETNPFIPWLLHEGWRSSSIAETLNSLAAALQNNGTRPWRLRLFIRTLNPQLYGKFYAWQRDQNEVVESQATHKGMQSEAHLNSPYVKILNGEGGIRRNLEGDTPLLDYPILHDLLAEGATDYVSLPMQFADQQINILSLVSDQPGGFKTSDLGHLYEILPHLGRLIEAHAQRDSALTLLQTYLGRNAGQRVLDGLVKRGDGEDLDAIIWFSDLRNSTRMADTMDRLTYLKGLDQYFDCVAGAIVSEGGEVLKFIGDAILAIFPVKASADGLNTACAQTVAALASANRELDRVNQLRSKEGLPNIAFGTGLHRGNITYGNIGAETRLDFTVIGPAVNEASRIEGMCKQLGHSVVASSSFAEGLLDPPTPLGDFELAGVKNKWALFAIEI